jgi:aspartate aminotransferase
MNSLDLVSLGKIVTIREQLMKAQKDGMTVYRLESGDPSFPIHPKVRKAIEDAMSQDKTHYVPVDGIPELRKEIANYYNKHHNFDISASDVFITSGAMHGLYIAFQAIHEDFSENRIIMPEPEWTEIFENVRLAGLRPIQIAFDPEGTAYTADRIKDLAAEAILINSPHNPTGAVLSLDQKKEFIDRAVEYDEWLISDEAYETVTYGENHIPLASLVPNDFDKWISIHSTSKSFAMSGMRLGFLITKNARVKQRLSKIIRCSINGVNSITQWGVLEAFKLDRRSDPYFKKMNDEYAKRRQIIFDTISNDDMASKVLKPIWPEGGFFLWCKVNPIYSADALSEKLAQHGLGNAPGSCFGDSCTQALRFSFSIATDQVEEGSKYLVELLNTKGFLDGVRM